MAPPIRLDPRKLVIVAVALYLFRYFPPSPMYTLRFHWSTATNQVKLSIFISAKTSFENVTLEWSLRTLYLSHGRCSYRRRLGYVLCALSMCDVKDCSRAVTFHNLKNIYIYILFLICLAHHSHTSHYLLLLRRR